MMSPPPKKQKAENVSLKDLPGKVTTTAPPKVLLDDDDQEGFISEHRFKDGRLVFSKITMFLNNAWISIMAYNPAIEFAVGSRVAFKLEYKDNRPTATDVVLIEEGTSVNKLFVFVNNEDNHSTAAIVELYATSLVEEYLGYAQKNPKGSNKEFLKSLGIEYIVGRISNKYIVKLG